MKKMIAIAAVLLMCVACERNDVSQIFDDNEKLNKTENLTAKAADSSWIEIIDSVDPKDIVPPRR